MTDYPAVSSLLWQWIGRMEAGWPWRRKRVTLLRQTAAVLDEITGEARELRRVVAQMERDVDVLMSTLDREQNNGSAARQALAEEQARSAALERELAQAWEAAGFERNGFDKLAAVHDCLGTIKDLLKALDLVGDGIGGDVGFAVSAVANEAAMSADSAWCEAGSMIEMRKKVVSL